MSVFKEGWMYHAEYEVTCFYKGWTNVVGTGDIPAKCIKRTKCYATFEVESSIGKFIKRARIQKVDGGEMVHLTNNGRVKDLVILSDWAFYDEDHRRESE